MNARTIILTVFLCGGLADGVRAGEKLYLTRTFQLSFEAPGSIDKTDGKGATPVDEKVGPRTYELVLPKKIRMAFSIRDDNEEPHVYNIVVKLSDDDRPHEKGGGVITPDDTTKNFWYDRYRFTFTILEKDADIEKRFKRATIRLDVYAPGEK